jgi:RsiW-degrading membrane proteinase PrsW (M82 family)
MAASLFLPHPMPQPPDFTAILEEAFRAEVSAAYLPTLITALLTLAVTMVGAWLLYRFFKMRNVRLPKNIGFIFVLIFCGMWFSLNLVVSKARSVRKAALAEIPEQAKQANGLVHRLLGDSTGTAVATESGTYLALGGEQIFLPTRVADALQKELTAKNFHLP